MMAGCSVSALVRVNHRRSPSGSKLDPSFVHQGKPRSKSSPRRFGHACILAIEPLSMLILQLDAAALQTTIVSQSPQRCCRKHYLQSGRFTKDIAGSNGPHANAGTGNPLQLGRFWGKQSLQAERSRAEAATNAIREGLGPGQALVALSKLASA